MRYALVMLAIFGVSAVQLLVKYRFNVQHGAMPTDFTLAAYLLRLLRDPWMWVAGGMLVTAALLWYFALSRMPLSIAIAFASLVYPAVIVGSAWLLGETVRGPQIAGCGFIVIGIWLVAAYS